MLRQVEITNYKSIDEMTIDLGRVNVFIGENGAGKSNILEAIALASAANANKLDNEFLLSRGIRVTEPNFMRSALQNHTPNAPIKVVIQDDNKAKFSFSLTRDDKPYSSWINKTRIDGTNVKGFVESFSNAISNSLSKLDENQRLVKFQEISDALEKIKLHIESGETDNVPKLSINIDLEGQRLLPQIDKTVDGFIIFSPENSSLRTFERESQVEPLGINGEGLLKLLTVMSQDTDSAGIDQIKTALRMLNWFDDFHLVEDAPRTRMEIVDRFLDPEAGPFDQRSANEGFLFITFFFTLFASSLTPKFFAIDNIDASLNPKLCEAMTLQLVRLAQENDKQVILTTHQPAVLDGLDLNDDEQRLFIISRKANGATRIKRYAKPLPAGYPRRMSELFLSGSIGGLPKSF